MTINSRVQDEPLTPPQNITMADILLAFLYANGCTPIASKKKVFTAFKYLQDKLGTAFGLKKTLTQGNPYIFEYGEYGYWSIELLNDIEMLVQHGMISVRKLEQRNIQASTYYLTGAGKKAVEGYIHGQLTKTQILILSQLKDMVLSNAI